MELDVTISIVVLLPVALALVAGGLVLYRRSARAGWRATGMGSLVLGVGTLLVFALTLPVSREGEAPEPVIGPATQQGQSGPAPSLAQDHPGPSGSPRADAPPIPHGTPRVNLTYEGAVYYAKTLSDDDAANLNENDLELVGLATESNLLLPAGSEIRGFIVDLNHDNPELTLSEIKDRVEAKFQIGLDKSTVGRTLQGLNIYKLKDGEEGYVYTFTPGHSMVNPEDGQIFEFQPEWMRWAAADFNGT